MKSRKLVLIEEICNSVLHGIGFLAAIVGIVLFFVLNHTTLTATKIVGFSIFGASLLILYSMSTLLHSLMYTRAQKVFQVLDHTAVFILIAGTYTPLLLVMKSTLGFVLLGIIWTVAVIGIIYKSVFNTDEKVISMLLYLGMGWLILVALKPLLHVIHFSTFLFLFIGGICYTIGTIFFTLRKVPFNHVIWHFFVILGSLSHFLAIYML